MKASRSGGNTEIRRRPNPSILSRFKNNEPRVEQRILTSSRVLCEFVAIFLMTLVIWWWRPASGGNGVGASGA